MEKAVKCSFPGCGCLGIPELFFVPGRREVDELAGKSVTAADLAKFAICDRCAKRLFHKEGVRTWPLVSSQKALAEAEEQATYVAKLKQAAAYQPKGIKPKEGAVGQGLSRLRRHSVPASATIQ